MNAQEPALKPEELAWVRDLIGAADVWGRPVLERLLAAYTRTPVPPVGQLRLLERVQGRLDWIIAHGDASVETYLLYMDVAREVTRLSAAPVAGDRETARVQPYWFVTLRKDGTSGPYFGAWPPTHDVRRYASEDELRFVPLYATHPSAGDAWVDTRLIRLDGTILFGRGGFDFDAWEGLRWEMHTPQGSWAVWKSGKRWSMYGGPLGHLALEAYVSEAEARADAEHIALSQARFATLSSGGGDHANNTKEPA